MTVLPLPDDLEMLEATLESLPEAPAVFLLQPPGGTPLLARTNVLRRRLRRLLSPSSTKGRRALDLRGTVRSLEYSLTGSLLEALFLQTSLARERLGEGYRKAIRLRMPYYVKLILTNRFPRTQVTNSIGRARAVYFGPFRSRAGAARYESEFLDLFQLRRCFEDLQPTPEHPGCIYGEMGRCCRPCQTAVNVSEYRSEAQRVAEFFYTGGRSLLDTASAARERFSEALDFEGAALMHQRFQKIEAVLELRDEMARDVKAMFAAAIVPAAEPTAVNIGWIRAGQWQGFRCLPTNLAGGAAASLDARIREMAAGVSDPKSGDAEYGTAQRAEDLAILARWFYSSYCDGELVLFDRWEKPPYRKLVNAVSRVAQRKSRPGTHSG